ncbi:MAG: hypothetical protein L3J52_05015, partial [Proteobacteria bacterium]|nr:hypothetical protein [Pseudomonadota bacterium]
MKKTLIPVMVLMAMTINAQTFTTDPDNTERVDTSTGYLFGDLPVVLSQNTDVSTITALNSVACPSDNDSYLRRFDLDGDHGLTGPIDIDNIDFGVETTTGIGLTVNLYSIANADALLLANLNLIGSTAIAVTAADIGTIVNAVVAGSINGATDDLVVEIFAPDTTQATTFFIGSNANGQSAPTFLMAAGCAAAEPTDVAGLGFADMHAIIVANGTLAGPPP